MTRRHGGGGGVVNCSCGNAESHVIARRSTADGKHVLLWDDGSLTWALGYAIKGSANPKTPEHRRVALTAGRLVLGDVCLYDAAEVPTLINAARWAAGRSGLPGDMRARYAALTAPRGLTPHWETLQADRDGKPTVRVWRLPRLQFGGLLVWHERGVYSLLRSPRRDDVYEDTGFNARTLSEIQRMLPSLRGIDCGKVAS